MDSFDVNLKRGSISHSTKPASENFFISKWDMSFERAWKVTIETKFLAFSDVSIMRYKIIFEHPLTLFLENPLNFIIFFFSFCRRIFCHERSCWLGINRCSLIRSIICISKEQRFQRQIVVKSSFICHFDSKNAVFSVKFCVFLTQKCIKMMPSENKFTTKR